MYQIASIGQYVRAALRLACTQAVTGLSPAPFWKARPQSAPAQPARARKGVTRLLSCGGGRVADGQPDGPVAEIGDEVQPSAEGLEVAGDDLQ
jgi:hypothetical protein